MQSRRIFETLRTLNGKEFKEFGKFISSPFHNSNKNLIPYYDFLSRYYPKFMETKTTPEIIYQTLFPGKKLSLAILRNLDAELVSVFKDYLAFSNYKKKELRLKQNLLEELRERKLESQFNKEFKSSFDKLESIKLRDEDYYFDRFNLESELSKYYDTKFSVSKSLSFYNSKRDELNDLINYFLIKILKEYITQLSGGEKIEFEKNLLLYEEIMSFVSNNLEYYKQIGPIYFLFDLIKLKREPDNENTYYDLKNILLEKKDSFNEFDLKTYYYELLNYSMRRRREGLKKFDSESFELIKVMLDLNLFLDDNQMLDNNYINIPSTAFRIKDFNWAENFINKYKEKLPPKYQDKAYNYNYAVLHYVKGDYSSGKEKDNHYEKALDYLSRVVSEKDEYYMTRIKNLSIRLYYELNEVDLAMSIIHGYKQFLSRCKIIPKNLKTSYLTFAKHASKILKIKTGSKVIFTKNLKEAISKEKNIIFKAWLLEKIDELEQEDFGKVK